MGWDRMKAVWPLLKAEIKTRWEHLTDADIDAVPGDREGLALKVSDKYGMTREDARLQVDDWASGVKDPDPKHETTRKPLTVNPKDIPEGEQTTRTSDQLLIRRAKVSPPTTKVPTQKSSGGSHDYASSTGKY